MRDPIKTRNDKKTREAISARFHEILEREHLTKSDIARLAEVSPTAVGRWFDRGTASEEHLITFLNNLRDGYGRYYYLEWMRSLVLDSDFENQPWRQQPHIGWQVSHMRKALRWSIEHTVKKCTPNSDPHTEHHKRLESGEPISEAAWAFSGIDELKNAYHEAGFEITKLPGMPNPIHPEANEPRTPYGHKSQVGVVHDDEVPEGWVTLPVFDLKLAAGEGAENLEFIETEYTHVYHESFFRKEGVKRENVVLGRVLGRSMENWAYDGEIVMLDTSDKELRSERNYGLYIGGAVVKQVIIGVDNSVTLKSFNPDFKDVKLDANQLDNLVVLGKVVERKGRGR